MFKWEKKDSKAPSKRADFVVCWIKDLLQEGIKQTTGRLQDNNGRCCLGVACDTAKLKWRVTKAQGCLDYNHFDVIYGKNDQYIESQNLPSPIYNFLKCGDNGYFRGPIEVKDEIFDEIALSELNDEYELSFREIAEFIQKYCDSLFKDLSKKESKYIKAFQFPESRSRKRTFYDFYY